MLAAASCSNQEASSTGRRFGTEVTTKTSAADSRRPGIRELEAACPNNTGGGAIDAEVGRILTRTHAKGIAVAVIDRGKVHYIRAYGIRNAKGIR